MSVKFSKADIDDAIAQLAMCRYFPADEAARAAVGVLLAKICPHREALEWVVGQFADRIGEWRGPVELRAVLCWRYRPADGIEANSTISGYTPADGEARSIEEHEQRKIGWDRETDRSHLEQIDSIVRRLLEE